ncbi:hypothetical protein LP415_09260 [Polaromonas sp. P1(28)-8]|nr:hypothetical protein LP415_09260 [Polaromonas sp. P1(28)-8]
MALGLNTMEVRFEGSTFWLSARRLWEHTELGQINVFDRSVNSQHGRNDPAAFIDVMVLT